MPPAPSLTTDCQLQCDHCKVQLVKLQNKDPRLQPDPADGVFCCCRIWVTPRKSEVRQAVKLLQLPLLRGLLAAEAEEALSTHCYGTQQRNSAMQIE